MMYRTAMMCATMMCVAVMCAAMMCVTMMCATMMCATIMNAAVMFAAMTCPAISFISRQTAPVPKLTPVTYFVPLYFWTESFIDRPARLSHTESGNM